MKSPSATATIRRLRRSDRRPDRVIVTLDDERTFSLPLDVAARLRPNQVLGSAELRALKESAEFRRALDGAAMLLARRPRSRSEVEAYLTRKQVAAAIRDRVLERLTELGLVDDMAFARWWVENRSTHRPRGRRALAYELARKGVASEIVAAAVASVDERAAARAVAERLVRRGGQTDPATFARRLYSHLVRRGFDHATAQATVRSFGLADGDEP